MPGLIHTYPDKVLLLATLDCAVHCQYCTRGRLIGKSSKPWKNSNQIFQWLEKHEEVRDVLISGGDPLMLSDTELNELFSKLRKKTGVQAQPASKVRKIDHIRNVRLGTKIPSVMPGASIQKFGSARPLTLPCSSFIRSSPF